MQKFLAESRRMDALTLQRRQQKLGDRKSAPYHPPFFCPCRIFWPRFELLCRKCDYRICGSEDVRTIQNSQYVVVEPGIWQRVHIVPAAVSLLSSSSPSPPPSQS